MKKKPNKKPIAPAEMVFEIHTRKSDGEVVPVVSDSKKADGIRTFNLAQASAKLDRTEDSLVEHYRSFRPIPTPPRHGPTPVREIVFEDFDGVPIPRFRADVDAVDNKTVFTLAAAQRHFDWTESRLRALWDVELGLEWRRKVSKDGPEKPIYYDDGSFFDKATPLQIFSAAVRLATSVNAMVSEYEYLLDSLPTDRENEADGSSDLLRSMHSFRDEAAKFTGQIVIRGGNTYSRHN